MAWRLADIHLAAQERLRALTSRAVGTIWDRLGSYDEDDATRFVTAAAPVVMAAQRQSVALTDAFVARSLGAPPIGIDPELTTGSAVRAGVPPEAVYRRPFVTVWTALAAGVEYTDAVNQGRVRATSTAEMDVQLAHRAAYGEIQRATPRIRGFERVADGGACSYCQMVNGAFVKSAFAMGLHPRCGCGLDPVYTSGPATPLPDGVAIHDHGELGAVLTDASHNFIEL